MTADAFTPRSNGTIRLVFGDLTYELRRPTLGECRLFREALVGLAPQPDDDGVVPTLSIEERFAKEGELVAWWRDVVTMLDTTGTPFPDVDDDLPAWLLGPAIIPEVLECWLTRPSAPGR